MNALVSIIIPTYNRAQLLEETLHSIAVQTYLHWECLVVDDGSTDDTQAVVQSFIKKDARFQFLHRPKERPRGGNGARNHGFQQSKGAYIQWFDSDDLMAPTFLEEKLKAFKTTPTLDFVVSKSVNFTGDKRMEIEKYQGNETHALTLNNFLTAKVYWITYDALFKREVVSSLAFDERLRSSQETNFFIRFLAQEGMRGTYINEVLTYRRVHSSSIQQTLKKSRRQVGLGRLKAIQAAYISVQKTIHPTTQKIMLDDLIMQYYHLKFPGIPLGHFLIFTYYVILGKGILKATAFFWAVILVSLFRKGYHLVNYARS